MKKNNDDLIYELFIIGLVIALLLLSPIYMNKQLYILNNSIDCSSRYCYGVK